MLFQILSSTLNSIPGDVAMYGGSGILGSITTMIVQKVLDRKKDKTDVVSDQVTMLNNVNKKLDEVVAQLQEIACYKKKCIDRINGDKIIES
jgi:hypothetical protein